MSFEGKYYELPKLDYGADCEWFAYCDNITARTISHPVLGQVPICIRCFNKMKRMED